MKTIEYSIKINGDTIEVVAPFLPDFVAQAKSKLGGRWTGTAWAFDARNESAVRQAVKTYYGWEDGVPLVSVKLHFDEDTHETCAGIYRLGRQIAAAKDRDSGARLGLGVVLESGDVDSGGSQKNWQTTIDADTVLVVHDVPLPIAQAFNESGERCEIIPSAVEKSRVDVLREERERLVARLAEIDAELAAAEQPA